MPIHSLQICLWNDSGFTEETLLDPPWSAVEQAIRALDGRGRNDLYLQLSAADPQTWLAVGGGSPGLVVNGSISDQLFPVLVLADLPEEPEIAVVVGGQEGNWPRNQVIPLDKALEVVRLVHATGSFECGVNWQYV